MEATNNLERIRRQGRLLEIICLVAAVSVVPLTAVYWTAFNLLPADMTRQAAELAVSPELPGWVRLLCFLAALVPGVALMVMAGTGIGGLWGVLLPLWAALFGIGFVLPNAPVLALAPYGDSAGTAASLLGGVQFGIGAAVSPLVGLLGNDAAAMAAVIAGGLVSACAVLFAVARPWRITVRAS